MVIYFLRRVDIVSNVVDDIDWHHLPPTTAASVPVSVQGFANADAAAELGKIVGEFVLTIGSFVDLSTLDGVTIAVDFDAALAGIDRGMEGLRPLDRTNTEEMQGVAKTCQVVRDGKVKSHLVFNASMLVPLIAPDETELEDRQTALRVIAHECGHVQVNAQMEERVPDARLGTKIGDFERAVLFQIAEVCWDEYAVCRLTARLAPRQNEQHADTVEAVAPQARARANEHIRTYRRHGDLYRLLGEGGSEFCQPLKAAAYLLGGMDAESKGWTDYPQARAAIEAGGYATLIEALQGRCRALWESQADWDTHNDVLAPLIDLARDAFASGGIYFRRDWRGEWHIDVPFSPETMPH